MLLLGELQELELRPGKKLKERGHEVFNIDYKGGDFIADLSVPEGREATIAEVHRRYPDGIDAMICNAGVE